MGTVYSISRIGTFDDCRLRYKYQYIDRLKAEKETIEAYMGSRVHEALQELYGFVRNGVVKPREWLLDTFEGLWDRNLTDAVKVVRSEYTSDDYRRKGRKCLEDYHATYAPFDRAKVVATEKKVTFKLRDESGEVEFLGFIDRLDWNDRDRVFEIHDYKTSGSFPSQEDADRDEQLGLYHLAVRSEWPDAEDVRLVWHYLVFNREIVSARKREDLAALEKEIVRRVRRIQVATEFPPTRSGL
ncbi:MAG TPA: PD-(D/E)XK nuclease family protein, partial [Acidobacteriota bacterium]|nr:PD-(D/E)XK nuclease family protein [Acidobacteriota bacterium]